MFRLIHAQSDQVIGSFMLKRDAILYVDKAIHAFKKCSKIVFFGTKDEYNIRIDKDVIYKIINS